MMTAKGYSESALKYYSLYGKAFYTFHSIPSIAAGTSHYTAFKASDKIVHMLDRNVTCHALSGTGVNVTIELFKGGSVSEGTPIAIKNLNDNFEQVVSECLNVDSPTINALGVDSKATRHIWNDKENASSFSIPLEFQMLPERTYILKITNQETSAVKVDLNWLFYIPGLEG